MPADVLQRIYAAKAALLEQERVREPYDATRTRALSRMSERRGFLAALRASVGSAVVAEIKRASPSAGLIAPDFDPAAIARAYEVAGATAISVLTERDHFMGDLGYLDAVRAATRIPLLRKDFLWTRYHVAQSAAHGADCVLLIVSGMSDEALCECLDEARRYALDALVEVHDENDLNRAIAARADLIGVNNRDLRALSVDLSVSERLLPKIPQDIFAISESGIRSASDTARLSAARAGGFLIGEALMRAPDAQTLIEASRRHAR